MMARSVALAKTDAPPSLGRGGRPKKAVAERRIASTRADLTLAEKQFIRDQAKAAGMTEAAYVRHRALGMPMVVRHAKTDARLVHELNAIGVNLNQIARNLNADRMGTPGSRVVDLGELMVQLRGALDRAVESMDD